MLDLERHALKLPADKRKKILDKILHFKEGKIHVIKKTPKKTPFLYTAQEVSSLAGSCVHFTALQKRLIPSITPIYRLLHNWDLGGGKNWKQFKRLYVQNNIWLLRSLNTLEDAVTKNE